MRQVEGERGVIHPGDGLPGWKGGAQLRHSGSLLCPKWFGLMSPCAEGRGSITTSRPLGCSTRWRGVSQAGRAGLNYDSFSNSMSAMSSLVSQAGRAGLNYDEHAHDRRDAALDVSLLGRAGLNYDALRSVAANATRLFVSQPGRAGLNYDQAAPSRAQPPATRVSLPGRAGLNYDMSTLLRRSIFARASPCREGRGSITTRCAAGPSRGSGRVSLPGRVGLNYDPGVRSMRVLI